MDRCSLPSVAIATCYYSVDQKTCEYSKMSTTKPVCDKWTRYADEASSTKTAAAAGIFNKKPKNNYLSGPYLGVIISERTDSSMRRAFQSPYPTEMGLKKASG